MMKVISRSGLVTTCSQGVMNRDALYFEPLTFYPRPSTPVFSALNCISSHL